VAGDPSQDREDQAGARRLELVEAECPDERQDGDGKWSDATGYPPTDVLGTCFALLFLKRATPPVVTFSGPEKGE